MQEAVRAWVTVYQIAKQINLAEALQNLENLAPELGLSNGLEGWEKLSQQFHSRAEEGDSKA
ncbi:MAG: hypothetical protein AAB317_04640 [Nitrospirota bacterium]